MIIDSSVIVAISIGEPEEELFQQIIEAAPIRRLSGGSWIELSAVAVRKRIVTVDQLDRFLVRYDVTLEAVTPEQARIGHLAYHEYGLGSGHKARLNFGDCFSYALAKAMNEPLLYKGDDFTHTDVLKAIEVE